MLAIRHQIALNAGFANYRDYVFVAKHRFDYSKDCEDFHRAAEEVCVHCQELLIHKGRTLSGQPITSMDLGVDVHGRDLSAHSKRWMKWWRGHPGCSID